MSSHKEFKTDNLALCPYLQLKGLKYLRAELGVGRHDKPVISFIFEDPYGIGLDLQLDFVKSEFKHYRDIFFFFRSEIERLKRQLEYINLKESRKHDDKYIDENLEDKKEG